MLKATVLALGLLVALPLLAAPGAQISRMVQTPASAFDMFLFRLYEGAKCNRLVKNDNADEADLCMTSIAYDAESNLLSTFFRVYPGAEAMEDFVDQDARGRESILRKLLDNTARRVGALDSWGLIHSTPISHADPAAKLAEKEFRAELATRTTTVLSTSYDGVVYVATRHFDGAVKYFTNQ